MGGEADFWKRCSSCKQALGFNKPYYACSVSTCTRKRTGFVFCSVDCWETHLPLMRHREAWAVEETSPTREAWAREQAEEADGRGARRGDAGHTGASSAPGTGGASSPPRPAQGPTPVVRRAGDGDGPRRIPVPSPAAAPAAPREILVVASRLKDYVRQRYGVNTSDAVLEVLSDQLRSLCDQAVLYARDDGRKTLMDRDFEFLRDRK